MKQTPKRSKIKNANLVPKYNARVRQEFIDFDYLDQLTPKELEWLNQFMGEYNNGSPITEKVQDENGKITKEMIPEENLHPPKYKKSLYKKNNDQNNDMYGNIKAKVANTKLLNYEKSANLIEEELSKGIDPNRLEDAYLDFLEGKQLKQFILEYQNFMKTFTEVCEE